MFDRQSNMKQTLLGKKILIAEDDFANQKVASLYLRKIGCKTTVAENGSEAVQMMLDDDFDLILMDCRMPVMDGLQAARLIRQNGDNSTPIIAMTANIDSQDKQSCFDAGMDEFISKPVNLEQLQNTMKLLIDSKK